MIKTKTTQPKPDANSPHTALHAEPSDVMLPNPVRVLLAWPWVQWGDFFSIFVSEPNSAVTCWEKLKDFMSLWECFKTLLKLLLENYCRLVAGVSAITECDIKSRVSCRFPARRELSHHPPCLGAEVTLSWTRCCKVRADLQRSSQPYVGFQCRCGVHVFTACSCHWTARVTFQDMSHVQYY